MNDFYGVRIGIFTEKKDDMINLYSKQIISSTDPYLWMNAAEVTFLRAEGALRGWDMGGEPQACMRKPSLSRSRSAGLREPINM